MEQLQKLNRILIAGVPETFDRLSAILVGYKPRFSDTVLKAQTELKSNDFGLVMIGVHFDGSRMFDLLRYIKASESHGHIPVICYRLIDRAKTRRALTMKSVEITAKMLGAVALVDLLDFADVESANIALRKLVDQTVDSLV